MAAPTWQVRIDWDNAGDYSHAEADVSGRIVSSISAARGYDFDSAVVGGQTPGQFSVTLDNSSGDYSYYNNASPLHGNLTSGCLVQLRSTWQGVTRTRWTGYLTRIQPAADLGDLPTVSIQAQGILAYINQEEVRIPFIADALTSDAVTGILTAAGVPAAQQDVATGQANIGAYFGGESGQGKPSDLLGLIESTEAGQGYEDASGGYVWKDRWHRLLNRISVATYSDTAGAGRLYVRDAEHDDPLDSLYSQFEAAIQQYEAVPGDNQIVYTLGAALSIDPGQTTKVDARFTTGQDFIGVANWGAPLITANSIVTGMGRDLSSQLTVTVTPFTHVAEVSIENTSDSPVYITAMQISGQRLRKGSDGAVRAESAALQQLVGRRLFPQKPVFADPVQARYWTEWRRVIYEAVEPVVTVEVLAFRDDDHLLATLQREITDRITLDLTGDTKLDIDGDFFIEAIADGIDLDGTLTTRYKCVSAGPYNNYAITDLSETDRDTSRVAW